MEKLPIFEINRSINQLVKRFEDLNISLSIKREDLLHKDVSGNKFRKLKYNLLYAQEKNYNRLLTYGGAFSNHIAAVAAAGQYMGMETIGVIRGEELGLNVKRSIDMNPTLKFAASRGMHFHFVSRSDYREKDSSIFYKALKERFGEFYAIPEGGTNTLAVQGCEEILADIDKSYDYICCAVGTGGTIAGVINASGNHQEIIGFPALKGDFLKPAIAKYTSKENWKLQQEYHFGGYARVTPNLIAFINQFHEEYGISLDPVYTGKMLYGIFDMIQNSGFPQNSRILAIHTGGLQGIAGMNELLTKKNLPLIKFPE